MKMISKEVQGLSKKQREAKGWTKVVEADQGDIEDRRKESRTTIPMDTIWTHRHHISTCVSGKTNKHLLVSKLSTSTTSHSTLVSFQPNSCPCPFDLHTVEMFVVAAAMNTPDGCDSSQKLYPS